MSPPHTFKDSSELAHCVTPSQEKSASPHQENQFKAGDSGKTTYPATSDNQDSTPHE